MASSPSADVSAFYVSKYNRFVDTILGRINKILREKYDPVTVKLANPSPSTKSKTPSKKSKRRKTSKRHSRKSPLEAATTIRIDDEENSTEPITEASKMSATTASAAQSESTTSSELATRLVSNEVSATASTTRGSGSSSVSAGSKRKKNKNRTSTPTKNKRPAASTSNKTKKPVRAPQKATSTNKRTSKSKAKATLYGLSSLKRSGDVSVNMMSDHTTIRTKFNLGPLVLKVEKEFGRSNRKEVRSATATTAEMSGRLSLRVYHGGAATLHSIRVLQPKQMRIESADDHDRTREFVWKRSSHIAHLVSQKLSSATRSMLRPPPLATSPAA